MLDFTTREYQLVRSIGGAAADVLVTGSEDYCITKLHNEAAKAAKTKAVWMNTDASLNYYNEDDDNVRLSVRPSNVATDSFGKIAAIKALRDVVPGLGLRDAKEAIEAGMAHYGLANSDNLSAAQLLATIRAYQKRV